MAKLAPIDRSKEIDFSEQVRKNISAYRSPVEHRLERTTDLGILNAVDALNDNQKKLLRDFLMSRYDHRGVELDSSIMSGKKQAFLDSLSSMDQKIDFRGHIATTDKFLNGKSGWSKFSDPFLNLMFTFGLAKGDGSHPVMDVDICKAFGKTKIIEDQEEKRIAQEAIVTPSTPEPIISAQENITEMPIPEAITSSQKTPSFFLDTTKKIKDSLQAQKNEEPVSLQDSKETTSIQVMEIYILTKVLVTVMSTASDNHVYREATCQATSQLLGVRLSDNTMSQQAGNAP